MKASIFISYSRRETPFVSYLYRELRNAGHRAWLDFQYLVPAERWEAHIARAIQDRPIFLLVVSAESIKSKNVEYEWRKAIAGEKRIVLAIFEAVELPPELQTAEWIDFRTSFQRGIKTLLAQLEHPGVPAAPPPQRGFKTSLTVWAAFLMSLVVSLLSLTTFWTVYAPYHLFPLPYRILKRDFRFFDVQGILLLLPFLIFLSCVFVNDITSGSALNEVLVALMLLSILAAPLMLVLLRLPGMRRWGKPMASVPIFAHPYKPPKTIQVRSMAVMLDYAPEDRRYARAISRQLSRHGHWIVEDEAAAEAVIVLMSNFKKETVYRPEERTIFPVLLQDIDEIDPKLSPIQWVDFRRGLRNLKYFCVLLPKPARMLNALGTVPMGRQIVLPPIVQTLVYVLTFFAGIALGSSLLSVMLLSIRLDSFGEGVAIALMLVTTMISVAVIVAARQSLLRRQGRLASFRNLLVGLGILVFLWLAQVMIAAVATPIGWEEEQLENLLLHDQLNMIGGMMQLALPMVFLSGLALCLVLCLWHWRDFYRWMPAKITVTKKVAKQQKA